jgi:hypothetical protein
MHHGHRHAQQPEVVLQLWPLALSHAPLLLELCRLLATLLPTCFEARLAATTLAGPTAAPVCGASLLRCCLALLLGTAQPAMHQQAGGGVAAAVAPQHSGSMSAAVAAAAAAAGSSPSAPCGAGASGSAGLAWAAFAASAANQAVVAAAASALLGYASTDDGAAQLVKAGASCLPEVAKAVRACVVAAQRESEPPQQRQLHGQRLSGLLQLLAVLASRPEGQAAMLRPTVAPVVVELAVEVLTLTPQQQPAAAAPAAALLLLRNLAFSPDLRSPLLASGSALPLLLAAAESVIVLLPPAARLQMQQQLLLADQDLGHASSAAAAGGGGDAGDGSGRQRWVPLYGKLAAAQPRPGSAGHRGSPAHAPAGPAAAPAAVQASLAAASSAAAGGAWGVHSTAGNVCAAAYAASALWALMHNGEKVKAALRKLPAASARLQMVRQHAVQLLLLLQQQQQQGGAMAAAGGGAAAAAGSKAWPGAADADSRPDTAAVRDASPAKARGYVLRSGSPMKLSVAVDGAAAGPGAQALAGVFAESGSLRSGKDVQWWLAQLRDSCGMVLALMEAV